VDFYHLPLVAADQGHYSLLLGGIALYQHAFILIVALFTTSVAFYLLAYKRTYVLLYSPFFVLAIVHTFHMQPSGNPDFLLEDFPALLSFFMNDVVLCSHPLLKEFDFSFELLNLWFIA
jgi:hypothetical protein